MSDFVTFVCQETGGSGASCTDGSSTDTNAAHAHHLQAAQFQLQHAAVASLGRSSQKSSSSSVSSSASAASAAAAVAAAAAQYQQYSTMLPPPPLPPMARPVAIIRSTGDLTMVGSPPSSMSPPVSGSGASASGASPHHHHHPHHPHSSHIHHSVDHCNDVVSVSSTPTPSNTTTNTTSGSTTSMSPTTTTVMSSRQQQQTTGGGVVELEAATSPSPLSPQSQIDVGRKISAATSPSSSTSTSVALSRLSAQPYSTTNGREYFNHFHTQSAPVSVCNSSIWEYDQ